MNLLFTDNYFEFITNDDSLLSMINQEWNIGQGAIPGGREDNCQKEIENEELTDEVIW